MKNYVIDTMELPKHFIGMEKGAAYMIKDYWVRVIDKVGERLYKVYRSDSFSNLPPVIKDSDRVN